MNEVLSVPQSLALGVIQGLTEFIPVSSTAHLLIAPHLFDLPEPTHPHAFDTIIQAGTLLPVLLYFRRDWLRMLRALGRVVGRRRATRDPDERLALFLLFGTLPALVVGLLVERWIEGLADLNHHPLGMLVIGVALLGFGLVMLWVDRRARRTRVAEHMVAADAWFIGFGQALAVIPGVSRSGATITAGLMTGLTREDAARFSFLLYAPVMAAASGWKLLKLLRAPEALPTAEWIGMAVATVAAAIVGYACIAFLLRYLRHRSLDLFVFWRALVGALLIGMFFAQR
ncbi:MAG: undecaprenyl-diphosphate phosphatase [Armatimonadetes bacterium]|nr:undecaprenyl-diphosphate phosphatase [Armatimonadota bacterium]